MKQSLLLVIFMILGTAAFAQLAVNPKADIKEIKRAGDKLELQLYPNPTTDYISLNDNDQVDELVVYNLLGRQVRRFTYAKGEKYNVEDLPKGMYLVQLLAKGDRILNTQRLSKR